MKREDLCRTTSGQIDSYWSEKAKQKRLSRTRWWESAIVLRHINRIVCGQPVDGFSKGLRLELRELGMVFEHGVSVGCGNGTKEFDLMTEGIVKRFTLFELSTERSKQARDKAETLGLSDRVQLVQGDCFFYEFSEGVDLVHWNNSLHHMLDTRRAVEWSFDILTPGGVFYMDDFVGPTRFQWSDEALRLGTRIRGILPKDYLRNPYQEGSDIPAGVARPDPRKLEASDPSEAADSGGIIRSIRECFPDAKIKLTGGLIYHTTLNDILHNIDESDEKDRAILQLLLIIDELSLNSGVESQYAAALAVKPGLDLRRAHTPIPANGALRSARRPLTLLRYVGTGCLKRVGRAVLPYYTRFVPTRIKVLMPMRLRQTVKRFLRAS